ncbi:MULTISPECIES: hypothetical protein [Actinosynnema]|uniref:hypothetical protein n=1 Tax=Actinosynnema TaxID=40566 RepID=UPI0020A2CF76|nr:hypothetical protein [Actinosynnema pretiosum]MCP2095607.1 hypothetical protein [Actinosynnema pretiosum]
MKKRALATASAVCLAAALIAPGTALASVVTVGGPYATPDECHQALLNLPPDPNRDGAECESRADGHYLVVSIRD